MKKITDFIHKSFDYFKKHSDQIGYILLVLLYVFILLLFPPPAGPCLLLSDRPPQGSQG